MDNFGIDFGQLPEWVPYVGGAFYVGLEYFLGKTKKVQPNSVLEALLAGAGAVYKVLASKNKPQV